jgi:lipopolysaccharide biosynthesis glycosyltransferase
MNNYIFLTYLSNDRDYKGALAINYMLKKYNSDYKLACIVLENVSEKVINILQQSNIVLYKYSLIDTLKIFNYDETFMNYIINKHYYGKFFMYDLTIYDKIIYLDTDLLIKTNIDNLFLNDCSENKCYMTYDTECNSENNDILLRNYTFNSGVVIFQPNKETCYKFYIYLKNIYENNINSLKTDQDIFEIMNNNKSINVQHLEYKYNCPSMASTYFTKNNFLEDLIIIHFTLSPKPWNFIDFTDNVGINKYYADFKEHLIEWCKIYNEMVLDNAINSFNNDIFINLRHTYLIDTSLGYNLIDNTYKI